MDPSQGLCLGALFDIAATNVSSHPLDLTSSMIYPLYCYKYGMFSF